MRRARAKTSGVPCATSVTPSSPAPGPTSLTHALRAVGLGGKHDPMSVGAEELRRRLAEPQLPETHLPQDGQRPKDRLLVAEKLPCRVNIHRQDVRDGADAVAD